MKINLIKDLFRLAESISFLDVQEDGLGMYICQQQHRVLICPQK